MKPSKIFWLILLIMALLPASTALAQSDDIMIIGTGGGLLKNSGQITELYLDRTTGDWIQIMPDGATQTFNWGNGKSFIMTQISVRFYADTPNTQPYRLFFMASSGARLWNTNLPDITYPTTSSTVWGGGKTESYTPGVAMTVKPTMEVRQLPVPPNDPNSGPVISGTLYMRIGGYVVP